MAELDVRSEIQNTMKSKPLLRSIAAISILTLAFAVGFFSGRQNAVLMNANSTAEILTSCADAIRQGEDHHALLTLESYISGLTLQIGRYDSVFGIPRLVQDQVYVTAMGSTARFDGLQRVATYNATYPTNNFHEETVLFLANYSNPQ